MGKGWSSVRRLIGSYNIENRAHKELDRRKNQAVSAPRHDTTMGLLDKFSREHPEYLHEQQMKNEKLLEHLKSVKVDSYGPPPEIQYTKPYPLNRENPLTPEFGVEEPKYVPVGKVSAKQAVEFIANSRIDPRVHSAKNIATKYKLDEKVVEQVLLYFQTLEMHVPQKVFDKDNTLLGKIGVVQHIPALKAQVDGLPGDGVYPPPSDTSKK